MNTLEQKIFEFQSDGWVLLSRTGNTAQLRKPKGDPSCALVIILFLLGILPGILYLILHAVEKEQIVTLFVDEQGVVRMIKNTKGTRWGIVLILAAVILIAIVLCLIIGAILGNSGPSSVILSLV